jgi:hypothetical protein
MLESEGMRFDSWQEQDIFLKATTPRSALGPTQPPIMGTGDSIPRGKVARTSSGLSSPSSDKAKNGGATSPLPHTFIWRGA